MPVPGWTVTPGFTAVVYGAPGGYPIASQGPPSPGHNFFAGGQNVASSSATQLIDVSCLPASLSYDLSAYLGGSQTQDDNAQVQIDFIDASSSTISSDTIGPVLASDRGDTTSFLFRQSTGTVPTGTVSIRVTVTMTRVTPPYNDGYADNISLILTSP